jgi:hypothetical protein
MVTGTVRTKANRMSIKGSGCGLNLMVIARFGLQE